MTASKWQQTNSSKGYLYFCLSIPYGICQERS